MLQQPENFQQFALVGHHLDRPSMLHITILAQLFCTVFGTSDFSKPLFGMLPSFCFSLTTRQQLVFGGWRQALPQRSC
jgi:hypothetical protein